MAPRYNVPDHSGRRIRLTQETPGLEQWGVEVVPKDERTVGFWDLFVIWGGFSNVTNIYVASLALANMTGWLRVRTSTIASVVGILLAVAGIYSFQGLVNYLTLITALLIPTTGVLVVDYFVRNRRQMLAEELFKREDSAYW